MVTDNVPDQINGVNTTYQNIERYAILDDYIIHTLHPGFFRYIDCPKYNEVKLAWPRNIRKKIEEISPDYIHIQTEGPVGLWARKYLALGNIRHTTSCYTTKVLHLSPDFLGFFVS